MHDVLTPSSSTKELKQVGQFGISPEFFVRGLTAGVGPCSCTSKCCDGGVYADVQERDLILAHKDIIKRYMDETQTTDESLWFETHEEEDTDFPSGRCIGTREINNKCAFLEKYGQCTLQVAATREGMHKWDLKPLFCILYPVVICGSVILFDDMLQGEQSCCSASDSFDVPLFEVCKEELTHLLGESGYASLGAHYQALQSSSASPSQTKE